MIDGQTRTLQKCNYLCGTNIELRFTLIQVIHAAFLMAEGIVLNSVMHFDKLGVHTNQRVSLNLG